MLYEGTAVNGDCQSSIFERPLKGTIPHGFIIAGYAIPFAAVAIIIIVIILLSLYFQNEQVNREAQPYLCLMNLHLKVEKFEEKFKSDVGLQGNLVATTLICCFATLYIFILDIYSIIIESRGSLPGYYLPKQNYFFYITIICSIILIPWIYEMFFLTK